jgi:hypothetical protein
MNPIQRENLRPGTRDWQLSRVQIDRDGFRSPAVEGYCSLQSVAPGDSIQVMVSADPPRPVKLEIFRMGWYGGLGARLMKSFEPVGAFNQPTPEMGEYRLIDCRWKPSIEWVIPHDWLSGVYLGRLTRIPSGEGELACQSYVVFIVRDDRPAQVLFQCSDNTWQAYNRWPRRHSLYDDGNVDWFSGPDVRVGFDRPYGKYRQIYDNPQSVGSGEFLLWEYPLCFWLEQQGHDVTYCSQADLLTPRRGLNCGCFLSVGHDEYWDLRQYESVMALKNAGVDLLFLSGNSVCWVTPMTPASDGRPERVITRAGPYGGFARQRSADRQFQFTVTGPDEGLLMGARNVVPVNGGGDWICARPDHWVFRGTGMSKGDRVPGLVGWEYHGAPPGPEELPGIEVVAEGTALRGGVTPQHWTATIHPGPRGNFVFNAATIFWAQGLSDPPGHMLPWSHWTRPHGPDPRVQRITANLLERSRARWEAS